MPFQKGHVFTPLEDRFWAKVRKTRTCWVWTAFVDKAGYGRIQEGGRTGTFLYAHRLSYEIHVGLISPGMHIDHLCHNRVCVNPKHLEAVTPAENTRRTNLTRHYDRGVHLSTHCKHGHERTPENTQYKANGYASYCKVCRRAQRHDRARMDRAGRSTR